MTDSDKRCPICGFPSKVWVNVGGLAICEQADCQETARVREEAKPPKRSLNLGRPAGAPKPPGVG